MSPDVTLYDAKPKDADPSGSTDVVPPAADTAGHVQALWFLSGQTTEGEIVRHVPIHSFPFRVGRRGDAGLVLSYGTVSGLHAEFVENSGHLMLRDLGSTNGTFVNGNRVAGETKVDQNDLVQFAEFPFRVRRQSSEHGGLTLATSVCDYALALVQFDQLMSKRTVIPYFQPVVNLHDGATVAYEVLGRSGVYGLETPELMFHAASQLGLELELSRMFRWEAARASSSLQEPPHLFVNTHPKEISDPGFVESLRGLREFSPRQKITVEIHESAVTDATAMGTLRMALNELKINLAYDDFGAGQDRLIELIEIRPDYLKFDMGLIRDIDRASAARQKMLETLVKMIADLGIAPLAEGVETDGEGTTCRQLGFQLAQGFYYGKPARASSFEDAWHNA
jgi:EAL domain-containing protein (putative c-di-GMP-specific phosphodiesterase class I)